MAVTIRDVARVAGVSVGAISRILNNDPSLIVTEETRQLVWDVVRKMHYKPLRHRRKVNAVKKLAVFIATSNEEEVRDPYWALVREGVEQQAEQLGYIVSKSVRKNGNFMEFAHECAVNEIDGILAIGSITSDTIKHFVPDVPHIVFISYRPKDSAFDSIWSDLETATRNIIDYFLSEDYHSIGFIGGVERALSINEAGLVSYIENIDPRMHAYCKYMKKLDLYQESNLYIADTWDSEEGYKVMKKVLSQKNFPQAMIIANDMMAIGALSAIQESGLHVPDDMAIISFNDIQAASCMHPPLTTVRIAAKEMGIQAVKLLESRFDGRDYPVSKILPTRLIIRGSCGGNPGNAFERYIL